jgi:hypothetical protein
MGGRESCSSTSLGRCYRDHCSRRHRVSCFKADDGVSRKGSGWCTLRCCAWLLWKFIAPAFTTSAPDDFSTIATRPHLQPTEPQCAAGDVSTAGAVLTAPPDPRTCSVGSSTICRSMLLAICWGLLQSAQDLLPLRCMLWTVRTFRFPTKLLTMLLLAAGQLVWWWPTVSVKMSIRVSSVWKQVLCELLVRSASDVADINSDQNETMITVPYYIGLQPPLFYEWGMTTTPQYQLDGKPRPAPCGRGVGGGSLINGMLWNRGSQPDFDAWQELGNDGWGWNDLLPYFRKVRSWRLRIDQSLTHLSSQRRSLLSGTPARAFQMLTKSTLLIPNIMAFKDRSRSRTRNTSGRSRGLGSRLWRNSVCPSAMIPTMGRCLAVTSYLSMCIQHFRRDQMPGGFTGTLSEAVRTSASPFMLRLHVCYSRDHTSSPPVPSDMAGMLDGSLPPTAPSVRPVLR